MEYVSVFERIRTLCVLYYTKLDNFQFLFFFFLLIASNYPEDICYYFISGRFGGHLERS